MKGKFLKFTSNLRTQTKRIYILIFVLILFLHHLGVTFLYLLPSNPMSSFYSGYAKKYMKLFFSQGWSLFAPEPPLSSLKLLYRCKHSNQEWGEWKNPLDEAIKTHQRNRFTFYGKLLFIYQFNFRHLWNMRVEIIKKLNCKEKPKDSTCEEKTKQETRKTKEYKRVNKFVSHLCVLETEEEEHEFKILRSYVKDFSDRNNPEIKEKVAIESYSGKRDLKL